MGFAEAAAEVKGLTVVEELVLLLDCVVELLAGSDACVESVLACAFWICPAARMPQPPSVMATDAAMIKALIPIVFFLVDDVRFVELVTVAIVISLPDQQGLISVVQYGDHSSALTLDRAKRAL